MLRPSKRKRTVYEMEQPDLMDVDQNDRKSKELLTTIDDLRALNEQYKLKISENQEAFEVVTELQEKGVLDENYRLREDE